MDHSVGEQIDELVRASAQRQSAATEEAIERMLVSPDPLGVLVEIYSDGGWRVSLSQDESPMEITYRHRSEATPNA